jgi:hypothetical protein
MPVSSMQKPTQSSVGRLVESPSTQFCLLSPMIIFWPSGFTCIVNRVQRAAQATRSAGMSVIQQILHTVDALGNILDEGALESLKNWQVVEQA